MAHTKGNWKFTGNRFIEGNGKIIAKVEKCSFEESEKIANGKLLAAAPELHERTRQLLNSIDFRMLTTYQRVMAEKLESLINNLK